MHLIWYVVPLFLLSMLLEWLLTKHHRSDAGYTPKDTAASLAMGLGNRAVSLLPKALLLPLWAWLYEHRLFDIPTDAWWAWALCFLAEDHCYYWFHRMSHQVRFMWAAHVNHHSSTHYNLSTALRQSWTTPLTGPVFWLPLPLIGFHPSMVIVAMAVSLVYQFWIHTEWIGSMGPFGWVFNTPSHHRVHHGRNPEYLDRNHAGILIIWDRLYGTFEPEKADVDYGITTNLTTYNPFIIAFHEWGAMLRDAYRAKTLRGRIGTFFMPPGWREDGTGKTAAVMRREAEKGPTH